MRKYKTNIKYIIFILPLGLLGCFDEMDANISKNASENKDLRPFNLLTIKSGEDKEQATFEWDGPSEGVKYTICMKDNDAQKSCDWVGQVRGRNELPVRLDSSHEASRRMFFILAEKDEKQETSNEMQIDSDTINNLIPSIQTENPALENATFAKKIAISGNGESLAVTSSNADTVYIYRYNRLTGWKKEAAIKAPVRKANFGTSLSFNDNGNKLVIAAKSEKSSTGAAYIYAYDKTTWKNIKRFSGDDLSAFFGSAVSFNADGTRLAIGSQGYESTNDTTGAVYIYTDNGNNWSDLPVIIQPENAHSVSTFFGHSVSLSANGKTLAVGAYGEGFPALKFAGAGYVFTQTGNQWGQEAHITLPKPTDLQYFAKTVSLNEQGDQLALTHSGSQSVRLYSKKTKWADAVIIKAPNTNKQENFGSTLAFRGNTLAVGAPNESSSMIGIINKDAIIEDNNAASSGAVYLYNKSNDIWSFGSLIKSSEVNPYHFFGTSVSLSKYAEKLAIGAPANAGNLGKNDASVYLY